MERIEESPNAERWPRERCKSIDCRKRDLVIRIADWTRDKDEPAYDVECYIGGVYDWSESQSFTRWSEQGGAARRAGRRWKAKARARAVAYAQAQIAKLL
jgi:hypothetical protein